ncbi:helix-turn-helix domain-containing protein [Brevibacillus sp. SIMBA_040]|uniref:helix-turn-helix domain-containing protein n=1 Tax=unclassified Brevibacillus TaxID=2684853 RepID=UPI00397A6680
MSVVQSVKTFLIDSYKQKVVLDDIAKHVGMSAFYLDRLFKQHTSVTPRSYLEKIRVDKAAHLIHTTRLSNLEIGYEVGFQSPSHF